MRARWRPIIRLRLQHGRRVYLTDSFTALRRLARVKKLSRSRFELMQGQWKGTCFKAWKGWAADQLNKKRQKLLKAAQTIRNVSGHRAFRSWQIYHRSCRRARRLFFRAIGRPAFTAWTRHTVESLLRRRRDVACITIQRHARGWQVSMTAVVVTLLVYVDQ